MCAFNTAEYCQSAGTTVTVTKHRDLNQCTNRESSHNTALLDSVNIGSAAHSGEHSGANGREKLSLLLGDYALEQTLKAGVLDRAQLTEEYTYVPHSAGTAGLRARVTTKLQLKKTAEGKIGCDAATVQHDILFEKPHDRPMKKVPEGALKTATAATVEEFTATNAGKSANGKLETGGVRPAAAKKFSELVHLLRLVTKEELLLFHKQISSGTVHERKDTAKAVFLDALFRTATSESVEAVAQLLAAKGGLDKRERRMAYVSLMLVERVERDALQAIGVSSALRPECIGIAYKLPIILLHPPSLP